MGDFSRRRRMRIFSAGGGGGDSPNPPSRENPGFCFQSVSNMVTILIFLVTIVFKEKKEDLHEP